MRKVFAAIAMLLFAMVFTAGAEAHGRAEVKYPILFHMFKLKCIDGRSTLKSIGLIRPKYGHYAERYDHGDDIVIVNVQVKVQDREMGGTIVPSKDYRFKTGQWAWYPESSEESEEDDRVFVFFRTIPLGTLSYIGTTHRPRDSYLYEYSDIVIRKAVLAFLPAPESPSGTACPTDDDTDTQTDDAK